LHLKEPQPFFINRQPVFVDAAYQPIIHNNRVIVILPSKRLAAFDAVLVVLPA
jgi:hypothetical protein